MVLFHIPQKLLIHIRLKIHPFKILAFRKYNRVRMFILMRKGVNITMKFHNSGILTPGTRICNFRLRVHYLALPIVLPIKLFQYMIIVCRVYYREIQLQQFLIDNRYFRFCQLTLHFFADLQHISHYFICAFSGILVFHHSRIFSQHHIVAVTFEKPLFVAGIFPQFPYQRIPCRKPQRSRQACPCKQHDLTFKNQLRQLIQIRLLILVYLIPFKSLLLKCTLVFQLFQCFPAHSRPIFIFAFQFLIGLTVRITLIGNKNRIPSKSFVKIFNIFRRMADLALIFCPRNKIVLAIAQTKNRLYIGTEIIFILTISDNIVISHDRRKIIRIQTL